MRPVPYIGITGYTTNEEIKAVAKNTSCLRYPYTMAGVLVSQKTLKGELAKWPQRNPAKHALSGIFEPYACSINLVHYHTRDQSTLFDQLMEVDELIGSHCDGYQLNIKWPSPGEIERYRVHSLRHKREPVVVLQCGEGALEKYNFSPKEIARVVKNDYEGLVDYVLIDPSGGEGKEIDTNFARDCLHELFGTCRNIAPGIAGGLSAKNLHKKLVPLWLEMPEPFSIDAEGRLRDKNDRLDVGECIAYNQLALKLYPSHWPR